MQNERGNAQENSFSFQEEQLIQTKQIENTSKYFSINYFSYFILYMTSMMSNEKYFLFQLIRQKKKKKIPIKAEGMCTQYAVKRHNDF